jgi:Family of unknown function (DUF5759)
MALSAKQIAASEKKRDFAKKEYYKALLEQFCRKIKVSSELGQRDAILTVPQFLVGYPIYDLQTTVAYMCRQLIRLGYIVNLVGPLDIRVQWTKAASLERDEEKEEAQPDVYLPSLVNLKKTAQKLRVTKTGK